MPVDSGSGFRSEGTSGHADGGSASAEVMEASSVSSVSIDLGGMDTAETTEIVDRFRWMACELEEHLVSHDTSARHVPAAGFRFSPDSQFTKHRSPFGLERVPPTNSLVAFLRLSTFFSHRRFEACKFLTDPFRTTECAQAIL